MASLARHFLPLEFGTSVANNGSVAVIGADAFAFFSNILPAILGLLALVAVGWFALVRIRRMFKSDLTSAQGFTLEDLRRMRREGTMSEDEFACAREAMTASLRSKGVTRNESIDGATSESTRPKNSQKLPQGKRPIP